MSVINVVMAPSDLVTFVADTGLCGWWGDQPIKLNRYMSGNAAYGGSATSNDLLGAISKMRSTGGLTIGTRPQDSTIMWANIGKGQAYPSDLILTWGWCYDNFDQVQPIKVQLFNYVSNGHGGSKTVKDGPPVEMGTFLTSRSRFAEGMQAFIDRKGFGWDCIGFVQQYLLAIEFYTAYPGLLPTQYIGGRSGFTEVTRLDQIGPLNVIAYPWHVQIIDSVQSISSNQVKCTICQSSGWAARSGPMTNDNITITGPIDMKKEDETGKEKTEYYFKISGPSPVTGIARIGRSARLKPAYAFGA
ncbi:hypothetical protein [Methylobacterium brachythecii]|uniref:Uncharacterized protein n=1 Tax=Methylobacterium brachythecii TaxID=1176177 RepID=A0A7W6AJM7_9HYPH|nr:hypothetical protein [Methylobacterium brachythecii]MBB3902384.1 hypothetical protein [Methylobacterium brachythecii]GLS42232.1 hypothetical protein GCM10007884_02170 [Methylobacterium brachythecii]